MRISMPVLAGLGLLLSDLPARSVAVGTLDIATRITGIAPVSTEEPMRLRGDGVVVGFAEPWIFDGRSNGWDVHHPAFSKTRIAAYLDENGKSVLDADRIDKAGHGTHVAGILFGDGAHSETCDDPNDGKEPAAERYRGVAPGATALFLKAPGSRLDAYRIATLFSAFGAKVISNSWVYGNYRTYDDGWTGTGPSPAAQADRAARDFDVLLVFGAGNGGYRILENGYSLRTATVAAPALAKNVIAVGAVYNGRAKASSGFLFTPDGETLENLVAPFSAKAGPGLVHDQRWLIKPDLVAPGVDIVSTESPSATHPPTAFDRPWTGPSYASHPGTSMAAPLVAGSAALLHQYFAEHRHEPLPPELAKAILINSARITSHGLRGVDPVARIPGWQVQGWGRLALDRALDALSKGGMRFWSRPRALAQGEIFESEISAPHARLFKVTLAYLDELPTDGCRNACVVNDLDLEVESPSGRRFLGNVFSGDLSTDDTTLTRSEEPWRRHNTVESVFLEGGETGSYRVRVRAHRIPRGTQHFALVAAGYE